MKRPLKIILASIIIIAGENACSQPQPGELYGVTWYQHVNSITAGFASFDPITGTSQGISELFSGMDYGGPDHPSIDAAHNRCFLEFNPEFYKPMHLLTVDLQTGKIIYDAEVQSLGDTSYWIDKVFYNPADQMLYSIYTNADPYDSVVLVTIDPASGILTPVFKLSPTVYFTFNGFDSENQIIYGFYGAESPKKYLVAIDIAHHTESKVLVTPELNSGFTLAFNCNDGLLYGSSSEYISNHWESHIMRMDPTTGNTEYLTTLSEEDWFEDVAIDPLHHKLYLFGINKSTTIFGIFCIYDIPANSVSYVDYHGASMAIAISFDLYSPILSPVAAFECSNFCLNGITQFTSSPNTNAAYYFWNFDDASSQDNTSTLSNPAHIFSHAGDYNVELIVTNCQGSDTLVRLITIEDFPPVDIGPDTAVCTNWISPVILGSSVTGDYDVTWSTGESTPNIEVTTPGVYWMKVNAGCGSVSDTANVEGKICDCDVGIFPDLTSHLIQVNIGCDLQNFSHPRVTVYNMIGQSLKTMDVSNQPIQLRLDGVSSGMYVVRLEDNDHVISSQKVVFMK